MPTTVNDISSTSAPLTPQQVKLLAAMREHYHLHGVPAVTRELEKITDIWLIDLSREFKVLESHGLIRKQGGRWIPCPDRTRTPISVPIYSEFPKFENEKLLGVPVGHFPISLGNLGSKEDGGQVYCFCAPLESQQRDQLAIFSPHLQPIPAGALVFMHTSPASQGQAVLLQDAHGGLWEGLAGDGNHAVPNLQNRSKLAPHGLFEVSVPNGTYARLQGTFLGSFAPAQRAGSLRLTVQLSDAFICEFREKGTFS